MKNVVMNVSAGAMAIGFFYGAFFPTILPIGYVGLFTGLVCCLINN